MYFYVTEQRAINLTYTLLFLVETQPTRHVYVSYLQTAAAAIKPSSSGITTSADATAGGLCMGEFLLASDQLQKNGTL